MKPKEISENGSEKQESKQQEVSEKNAGFSAIMYYNLRK